MGKGTVYILLNPRFPDLIKIGKTTRDPTCRARELSKQTGVPADYVVIYDEIVNDAGAVEKALHDKFAGYRPDRHKEFLTVRPTDAIKALQALASGSRVAFTDLDTSRDMLPELKPKCPDYVRPDIAEIRIVHKDELCLLETRSSPGPV